MTNKWLSLVTGQAVVESAPVRKPSTLRQVLGEAGEDEKAEKPEADKEEAPKRDPLPAPGTGKSEGEPEGEPEAAVDADIEAGAEASADSNVDNQAVKHLVSSWQSGSKMDVAAELLYTPVSYVDFAKMLFRIGEPDSIELGGILDQLSEVRPGINQPTDGSAEFAPHLGGGEGGVGGGGGGAERILSRIAQQRQQEMPVAKPAGETGPELDTAP